MRNSSNLGTEAPPRILFVCQHGSVKSAFARETLRRLAAEKDLNVDVCSRGVVPENHLTEGLDASLRADGVVLSRAPSPPLAQSDLDTADIAIVFNELPASLRPGRIIDWTDVPSMVEKYEEARAILAPRLESLIAELNSGGSDADGRANVRAAAALRDLFGGRRPSRWVTRERPKIDRIACPWLIRRFIDRDSEFIFVPAGDVFSTAEMACAVPFDIPGAPFSHVGDQCSFDAFVERFAIDDPGVRALQPIIRSADTDRHGLAPEAAGLHALSLGLSITHEDDHKLLAQGLVIYDALHAWAMCARGERHDWKP